MPAVAERQGWQQMAARCLVGWHLCSLDAPTVAVVWASMLAWLAGTRLQPVEALVLGLGTWIVYVLDRVLDGVTGTQVRGRTVGTTSLRERHRFHSRHRKVMLGLCCVAVTWLTVLCGRLPSQLVAFYLALAVPVSLYGVRVHWRLLGTPGMARPDKPKRKEAAVALLFTAAVAAPALIGADAGRRTTLLVISLLLAWLCWINCVLITLSEGARYKRRDWLQITGNGFALALTAAAVCGWGVGWSPGARSSPAAAAVLVSCLLLLMLLLGRRDGRMSTRRVRVLADVALLTPLLFLLRRP